MFSAVRTRLGLVETPGELEVAYRRDYPRHFHPDEDVLGGLRALREEGWRLGVVTNGPASQLDKIRGLGLDTVLDGWCISDVVGAEKPSRSIFEAISVALDVPLSGYMVGDQTETDILGGRLAGLRTVLVSRGREIAADATRPDEIVLDVREAIALIRRSAHPIAPAGRRPRR